MSEREGAGIDSFEDADVSRFTRFARLCGLHPLAAFPMFGIDWGLQALEGATLGAMIPITLAVGLFLSIPCTLIQRFAMREPWPLALGKGLIAGILTGVPTSLASPAALSSGVLGAWALKTHPSLSQSSRKALQSGGSQK